MNDLMTKSFTSYVDLKKAAKKEEATVVDLEMGGDSGMGLLLEEAEGVKLQISELRDLLSKLEQSNEESKTLHKPDALRAVRARINADIVTVLKRARSIRARLEDMDRKCGEGGDGPTVQRSRAAVTGGLRQRLREVMMEFQGLRQRMMAEYREAVERRHFTVTGETADEKAIDRMMMSMTEQRSGSGDCASVAAEIEERNEAAREIEASLLQLHQVFLDMAVMVEAQGDKLDDIEHHVVNASHYVAAGTTQLKGAKEYQRSSRRCACIALILLLILVLVIVVPIAASFSAS